MIILMDVIKTICLLYPSFCLGSLGIWRDTFSPGDSPPKRMGWNILLAKSVNIKPCLILQ